MAAALDGKVALITGGSAGIGKAAVKLFAEAGASVVFAARGAERGQRVEQELRQGGLDIRFVQADVSQSEQVTVSDCEDSRTIWAARLCF